MTTGAEDIARAIRDGFHELAEAITCPNVRRSRETGICGPFEFVPVPADPQGNHAPERPAAVPEPPSPQNGPQDAVERAAEAIAGFYNGDPEYWVPGARAIARAGLFTDTQPMTVGQLGAQHIGKKVSIDGDRPITVSMVHHVAPDWTWIDHGANRTSGHPDTPCTVTDA